MFVICLEGKEEISAMTEESLMSRCRLGTSVKKAVTMAYVGDEGIVYTELRWNREK